MLLGARSLSSSLLVQSSWSPCTVPLPGTSPVATMALPVSTIALAGLYPASSRLYCCLSGAPVVECQGKWAQLIHSQPLGQTRGPISANMDHMLSKSGLTWSKRDLSWSKRDQERSQGRITILRLHFEVKENSCHILSQPIQPWNFILQLGVQIGPLHRTMGDALGTGGDNVYLTLNVI